MNIVEIDDSRDNCDKTGLPTEDILDLTKTTLEKDATNKQETILHYQSGNETEV